MKLKEYEEEIKKEIKKIEESKSLKESCYDYFYKKFKDNWEKEFYKQHLKNIKSECHYLNLKLKLETIQKCKEMFKEMIEEESKLTGRWTIELKRLLSQLNKKDLKEKKE